MKENLRLGYKIKEEIGAPIINCPYMPLYVSPPPGGNKYNYDEANYLLSGMGIVFGNSRLSERSKIRLLSLISIIISDVTVQNSYYRLSFPEHLNPLFFEYIYEQRGHMFIYRGTYRLLKTVRYPELTDKKDSQTFSCINDLTRADHLSELFYFVLREALNKLKIKNGLHIDFSASEEKIPYNRDKGL